MRLTARPQGSIDVLGSEKERLRQRFGCRGHSQWVYVKVRSDHPPAHTSPSSTGPGGPRAWAPEIYCSGGHPPDPVPRQVTCLSCCKCGPEGSQLPPSLENCLPPMGATSLMGLHLPPLGLFRAKGQKTLALGILAAKRGRLW